MVDFNRTKMDFDRTDQILSIDALQEAENITGKSYKEDKKTADLGFGLHILKNNAKTELLKQQDDVYYGSKIIDYIRVLKDLGFENVYEEPFDGRSHPNEPVVKEMYYMFWHPAKFILCSMETYNSIGSINSSKWYFSYKPNNTDEFYENNFHFSGHWWGAREDEDRSNWIWVGNWSAIEAIRHEIEKCNRFGKFVEWPEPQFLQLNTYMDWNKCENMIFDYAEKQTIKRWNALPENIRLITKGYMDHVMPLKDNYKKEKNK